MQKEPWFVGLGSRKEEEINLVEIIQNPNPGNSDYISSPANFFNKL